MSAGKYRLPAILQRPVEVQGPDGSVERSYQAAGTTFLSLQLRTHSEVQDGERLISQKLFDARLRPFADLAGGWRMLVGERVFRVLSSTDPDGRNRERLCLVEEEESV